MIEVVGCNVVVVHKGCAFVVVVLLDEDSVRIPFLDPLDYCALT